MATDTIVEVHRSDGGRVLIGIWGGPLLQVQIHHGSGGQSAHLFLPFDLRRDLLDDHAALFKLRGLAHENGLPIIADRDDVFAAAIIEAIKHHKLVAVVLPRPPIGVGTSGSAGMPAIGAGATPPAANPSISAMSPRERILEMLRRTPDRLTGDLRAKFTALTAGHVLEEVAAALALIAILHATGAGEAIDAVLMAWVWVTVGLSGIKALYHLVAATIRAAGAQSDAELDQATIEFVSGLEVLGVAVLTAAVAAAASGMGGAAGGGGEAAETAGGDAAAESSRAAIGPSEAASEDSLAAESSQASEGAEAETGGGRTDESCETCQAEGEPVNPATGSVFSTHVDFTLPGVLPLVFERTWTSTSSIVGELGHGWHHGFDMAIRRRQGARGWVLRLADGRLAEFAAPASGHSTLNVAEGMQLWSDGRQLWATNFDGMRYEFGPRCGDGSRRLTAIRDANANAISLQRDGAGNLTAIRAAGGQRLTVRRDEHNRIAGIDGPDPAGAGTMTLVAFEYDQSGDLTGTRDAAGAGFRYGYAAHLLTEIRWPAGATFRFRYDDPAKARSARCVETSGEAELFLRRFDYDLAARTTTVRDSRGATRVYEWNEAGRVTGRTDGLGRRTAFAYDTHQRLTRETRPDGATRQWQFDEFGRLVARRDFDAAETSVAYAPPFPGAPISRQPARVVEPGNRTHIFAYDSRGNLVDYLDPAGRRRRYLRATSGLPLAVLDALGVRQRFEWTRDGRLARESTARGMRTEFAYDHLGRLVASRRAGEQPTRYVRDAVGDVVEIVRPTGGRVRLAYDAEHQVTLHRDATGNETRWDYDGLPYPSRRFNPDGTSIQYHYDSDLNLIGLTNAKNESYTLTYDLAGQLVEEVGFDGRRQRYEYDAAGQLTAHHDAESRGARYRRDAAGRLLERVFADGTRDRFAYDAAGRLTQAANAHRDVAFSYGRGGELLEERQDNWVLRHDYDTRGRRTATELPDGRTITVDWGEDDAFTAISFGGRSVVAVERDLAGRETGRRAGAVTSASAYDPQGRLIRQSAYRGAARERVLERGYEYDAADRLIAIDDLHRGMRRYQYNPCDRLVGVSGDNPESFVFDPAGNILGSAGQSGGVATGDRLLMLGDRKFEYDGCGNRVREVRGAGGGVAVSYAYGPDNQLVAVEERDRRGHRRTEFAYDALGRRIGKTHRAVGPGAANDGARGAAVLAEARTWFLWDGDRLLAEASGPVTAEEPADALETLYLHEPGTFRPAALVRHGRAGAADQVYHYHLDRLGTPQEVTNDNGQVAWQATLKAWGGVAAVSVAEVENPLRFQGQYHDAETGLHYNRFRYYSPSEGRFVHEDPIRLSGGSNLAAYAANPLQWIDPLGLACTRGMGGRALSQSQQAEFDAFGARAKSAGLVENPNRTGSWGRIGESGKYEEVARIDVGEPGAPGWGGKTHIHIDGGEDHLPLDTPIPGEP